MIFKEIILTVLLSGVLQIIAEDKNFKTELNSDEVHNKRKIAALQFYKDYSSWGGKKHSKDNSEEFRSSYTNINDIDSEEYIDKYNKYGKTFNPNLNYVEKEKGANYKKRGSEDETHHEDHEEHEKPRSLLHDLNVNYLSSNKEISGDSELIFGNDVNKNKENYQENYQNGNELYMKRFKKDFYQNLSEIDVTNPPPPNDTVMMARYIVHTVDWAALATLSGRSSTKGSPFVCVKATSDGMKNISSGIPFFYMSPMDLCTQDLQKDNRVSVLVTLSQTEYCKNQNLDPQDPRCAKLTLSGKIKKIKAGSSEEKFAKNALFSRHPAMESWPADHNWYFTKLKIGQIILLDQFGGATYIKVKDYLNGKIVEPELKKK